MPWIHVYEGQQPAAPKRDVQVVHPGSAFCVYFTKLWLVRQKQQSSSIQDKRSREAEKLWQNATAYQDMKRMINASGHRILQEHNLGIDAIVNQGSVGERTYFFAAR
jgi:hypothetical protein